MPAHAPHETSNPDDNGARRIHSAKLLLILLALTLPALLVLYITVRLRIHLLYLAALWLNLCLLASCGILVVISGVLGALEERRYTKLANPNTHPRPRNKWS